jgi:hypothetical protein
MREANLFKIFTTRLNQAEIQYVVTGAVASIVYGEPRVTHDIDLVIALRKKEAFRICGAFPDEEFYCPPLEVIQVEVERPVRGHFNLIHHETGFKADVYLVGEDELHRWAMAGRRKFEVEGEPVWLAPPEYVILRKLEYYREGGSEKHLRDIAGMIALAGDQIDMAELEKRVQERGLTREWESARQRAEE